MRTYWTAVVLAMLVGGALGADCKPPAPMPPPWDIDAGARLEGAPAPVPGGSPACSLACTSIAQAGCYEGLDPYCPLKMTQIETDRLTIPAICPLDASGHVSTGCTVTCAECAKARTGAEVVAMCGSRCTP